MHLSTSALLVGLGLLAPLVNCVPSTPTTTKVPHNPIHIDPLCDILHCPVKTTITETKTEHVTKTATVTSTETKTATATASPSCPPKSDLDTLPCDARAYLIQFNTLYTVDLETGEATIIADDIRPDLGSINAMGFNPLEGFIYAFQGAQLIRLGADGGVEVVIEFDESPGANLGEFDLAGQYWYSSGGRAWGQVDFFPGSPTYGQLVNSGTSSLDPINRTADWAFTPSVPGYLYGIGTSSAGAVSLVRWSTTTHVWETVASGYDLGHTPTVFGAIVATSDGIIYGSDNGSGQLYRFSVLDTNVAGLTGVGPSSSSNEAARCFLRPDGGV